MTRIKISACSGIHIGDRTEQQDRVAILQSPNALGCALAIVCDGMGGKTGGALAAQQVISTATELFKDFSPSRDKPEKLLCQIVEESHMVIRLTTLSSEQEPHSTIVALLLQTGRADWAHVGDSRLYHFRHGQLISHTEDHSYVNQLVAQGQLASGNIANHKMGHILTRAIGSLEPPQPTLGSIESLEPGDVFLLCSDGLWHYFTDSELGDMVSELHPREASEILVINARERAEGRGDNLSFAILKAERSLSGF